MHARRGRNGGAGRRVWGEARQTAFQMGVRHPGTEPNGSAQCHFTNCEAISVSSVWRKGITGLITSRETRLFPNPRSASKGLEAAERHSAASAQGAVSGRVSGAESKSKA